MKEQKNIYERAALTVVAVRAQDVITTSPVWGGGADDAIQLPEDIF